MKSNDAEIEMLDFNINSDNVTTNDKNVKSYFYFIPLILLLFVIFGFVTNPSYNYNSKNPATRLETKGDKIKNAGLFNILSSEDLTSGLKDTVYTDKNCWLELRIDKQMLYQHWRDGSITEYPISSGNKFGDPEALESRPGLFAIFVKTEHHISSQFSAANMYHFMPFNQGIGFHSIDGKGYYGHLGVRPSSHGCIRMKHEDAKKLYSECDYGTLVLATRGYSARAVAFAPEGFKNERVYTKDEYKNMLASNLYNLLNGRYYIEKKEKFVVDPKVIPVSGVYSGYDRTIPEKQIIPRNYVAYYETPDRLDVNVSTQILKEQDSQEFLQLASNETGTVNDKSNSNLKNEVNSSDALVKQYFHNPIGILPYFGPKK
ncbi:MAG: L,D-transpeptidase [Ignavibacteria bacterium]